MTATLRRVTATDGLELAWREAGEGPPLLLLHHAGGSSRRWSHVLPDLSRQRRVLALDLPGHGESPLPEGSAWDGWRRALPAFLDALDLEPPPVVAHSLSGVAAVQALLESEVAFPRLILVAPPAGHDLPPPIRISRTGAAERAVTWKSFRDAVRRRLAADPASVAEEDWEAVHEDFSDPKVQAALRTLLTDYPELEGLPEPSGELPPLDFVWMDRDAMVPAEVPDRWRAKLPSATHHRLEGLGHLPMLEAPRRFLTLLEELF